jgi:copper(I)-binding protein
MSPNRRLTAVAFAALLPLTACGDDNAEGEIVGGAAAPDQVVTEDVEVVGVELEYPEDGLWEEGESVPLYAAITNTGTTSVRLVDVRGEGFGDAELIDLGGDEGAIEIAQNDNAYLEPDGAPSIRLLGLEESLRSSQSIDVTFVFEDAGEVTVEAAVESAPPGDGEFEAPEDPTPEDG